MLLLCAFLLTVRPSNKSRTLPFENRKNIACIALSPDGQVLISIDQGGFLPCPPSTTDTLQTAARFSFTSARELSCTT